MNNKNSIGEPAEQTDGRSRSDLNVDDFFESWKDSAVSRPVRRDSSWPNSFMRNRNMGVATLARLGDDRGQGPFNEVDDYVESMAKLARQHMYNVKDDQTGRWMANTIRFTDVMKENLQLVRRDIEKYTILANANKLLLAEMLIESAESDDAVKSNGVAGTEVLTDRKAMSDQYEKMVYENRKLDAKEMHGSDRGTTHTAGIYRFIRPFA